MVVPIPISLHVEVAIHISSQVEVAIHISSKSSYGGGAHPYLLKVEEVQKLETVQLYKQLCMYIYIYIHRVVVPIPVTIKSGGGHPCLFYV